VTGSDQPLIQAAYFWRRVIVAGLLVLFPVLGFSVGVIAAPPRQPTPPVATPAPTPPAAVPYAVTCACTSDLFACSSFPFWSAAQACFNQCRIEVGFDIHGLDEDGDGVACELALAGPSPFTLPALPTATPAATVTATATLTASGALTPAATVSATLPGSGTTRTGAAVTQLPAYASPTAAAEPAAASSRPMTAAIVRLTLSSFVILVAAGYVAWVLRRPRAAGRDQNPPAV
jgi:hypothetical protein